MSEQGQITESERAVGYCQWCGEPVEKEGPFCGECGGPLEREAPAQSAPAAQAPAASRTYGEGVDTAQPGVGSYPYPYPVAYALPRQSSGQHVGLIVGLVIGGLATIGVIVAVILLAAGGGGSGPTVSTSGAPVLLDQG